VQKFAQVLNAHLAQCDRDGKPPTDLWYRATLGHFKMVGRRVRRWLSLFLSSAAPGALLTRALQYHSELAPLLRTFETLLFSSADARVASVFQLFKTIVR